MTVLEILQEVASHTSVQVPTSVDPSVTDDEVRMLRSNFIRTCEFLKEMRSAQLSPWPGLIRIL